MSPQASSVEQGLPESATPNSQEFSPVELPGRTSSKHSASSYAPRPSSCCIAVTVLSILVSVGVVTYFSVWDHDKTFEHWMDRFFASEKKLAKESTDGQTVLVKYGAGEWIFLTVLALIFLVNLTTIIPALTVIVRRRFKRVTKKLQRARSLNLKPSVDVIVPCYLPNEQDIIEETIWHILKRVESPGALKLWVVYNTPRDMPDIEEKLQAIAEKVDLPQGRKCAVVRAHGSKSKAENINLLLPQLTATYTVVYDADHHPDPESLMLLVEKITRGNLACAQGSTYIRDLNSGILARIIDAEFFVTHFIFFPSMRLLTRQGVFCGSNGLWKTDILQSTTFNHEMQTEDIDVSVRMLLEKHRIDFCPEARSGELAPVNLRALFKQRLRWAIGWDEVSLQLWQKVFQADAQSTRKAAVAYVCWSRWGTAIAGLIAGVVTPILGLVQRIDPNYCHCGTATQLLQTCMFYFYLMIFCSSFLEAVMQIGHRGCQSVIQVFFVALFMVAGVFYVIFQACLIIVSLFKIRTGTVGGWVVTARKPQKPNAPACDAVVDEESAPYAEDTHVIGRDHRREDFELEGTQPASTTCEDPFENMSSIGKKELEPCACQCPRKVIIEI